MRNKLYLRLWNPDNLIDLKIIEAIIADIIKKSLSCPEDY